MSNPTFSPRFYIRPAIYTVHWLIAPVVLALLFFAALFCRLKRYARNQREPRIVWGPTPIAGTQYYSAACEKWGYESDTLMYGHSIISKPQDFGKYPETIFPRLSKLWLFKLVRKYLTFIWALDRYEVHFHNFNGGFLQATPLSYLEVLLRQLGGGRTVVYAYGSDAQLLNHLHDVVAKYAIIRDYPQLGKTQRSIARQVAHYVSRADFVYGSVEAIDYLPYFDLLLMQLSAIDTERLTHPRWSEGPLRHKHGSKSIVLHAPNHRHIKGSGLLISACDELIREGRDDFVLVLLERTPNDQVIQAIADSDIVADQFILGSYAMFALEAMALGKPVMCYLRPDLYELYGYYSWARDCPVVNTPRDQIKEKLRWLLDHPEERKQIGERSRQFVEKYHSLGAMGKVYDAIIRKVWFGTDELSALISSWQTGQKAHPGQAEFVSSFHHVGTS